MSDDYDLKQCQRCGANIPSVATKCASCNTSQVDLPAPAGSRRRLRAAGGWSVTSILIAANVVFYLWSLYVQKRMTPQQTWIGLVIDGPRLFAVSDPRIVWGGGMAWAGMYWNDWVIGGHWWRVVSATFLHGGLLHIGFNMYALHQLGRLAESIFGPLRFLVVYLVTGFVSMAAISIWFSYVPGTPAPHPTVGASGAIFGVAGLLVVFLLRRGSAQGQAIARSLGFNLLLMLALGWFIPMISNTGHVGGLLPGMAFGLILAPQFADRFAPQRENRWRLLAAGLAAVAVVGLALAVHSVVTGLFPQL